MTLCRTKHRHRSSGVADVAVVLGSGRDSRLGTVYRLCAIAKLIESTKSVSSVELTDLNAGAGNAWASQSKLSSTPLAASKESDFADFGNFGDTRPAGSGIHNTLGVTLFLTTASTYASPAPPPSTRTSPFLGKQGS